MKQKGTEAQKEPEWYPSDASWIRACNDVGERSTGPTAIPLLRLWSRHELCNL
jgi:hypothetical protein